MSGHVLDWANQPALFKNYPATDTYALPLSDLVELSKKSLFGLLRENSSAFNDPASNLQLLRRRDIALLLLLTSAPTAKSTFQQGEIWYRSNASAGALHPLEFYLDFAGCDDLPAGLYHYDFLKPALNCLCCHPRLTGSTTVCHGKTTTPNTDCQTSTLCISALFYRTAWKYRERAYRYMLLDCGHALENLQLALKAGGLNFTIELNFDDSAVNNNLSLEEHREVVLAVVHFESKVTPAGSHPESKLSLKTNSTASNITYSALHEIHQATSSPLLCRSESENWQSVLFQEITSWQKVPGDVFLPESALSYVDTLSRRRSHRNFTKNGPALTSDTFFLLLNLLSQNPATPEMLQPGIIFSACGIDGFSDGLYVFSPDRRSYALLENRDRRRKLATAALDQRWVANATLRFIFFADLEHVEEEFGPRSYRYLNIEAGRLGQRLYLGATALNLGCCAVGAFYDRELAEVCHLPENFDPLYLVAVGPVAGK
jgi:SagB-type dehydrogenase family enzyme